MILVHHIRSVLASMRYEWRLSRQVGHDGAQVDSSPPARSFPLQNADEARRSAPAASHWPVATIAVRRALKALPTGGLATARGELVGDAELWGRPTVGRRALWRDAVAADSGGHLPRAFWCGALWQDNYYHWLTEILPRLALAADYIAAERLPVVVGPIRHRFQRESLRSLFPELVWADWPSTGNLSIEECHYMPAISACGETPPAFVAALRERARARMPATAVTGGTRLWIERTVKRRSFQPHAADDFARRLGELGYEVIRPETLDFAEQVARFARAEVLAGVHGAGLANMVWMRPETRVVECGTALYVNNCFRQLAEASGIDHRIMRAGRIWRMFACTRYGFAAPVYWSRGEQCAALEVLAHAVRT